MTGRYQEYPEYKDSGVDWLGDIPKLWNIKKIKYLSSVNTGTKDTVNAVDDGKYPFFVRSQTIEKINSVGANCEAVLTAGDGAGVGKVYHYYNGKFDYHQRVYMLSDFNNVLGKFVYYYLSSNFYKVALEGSAKSTVDSLRLPQFLNFEFSLPSIEEQSQVINFLDHETAKIDTLIYKQEKLIELLKEKRLATRYHTVTKGLNSNVSFVETGISWTPSAPEHWSLVPNRSVMSMRRVLVGQNYRKYQLLSLTKKGVLVRNISSGEGKQSDHLDRTQEVRKGDLVFCLFDVEETPRTVGLSQHLGMISGDYTVFECSNSSMARFLEYFYKAMDDRKLLKPLYRGLRKRIPKPGFLRVSIPVPPKEELENILQFLDGIEERIEQLTHLADKQVTLLKERKTALISAAVTGKIDVRNWQEH